MTEKSQSASGASDLTFITNEAGQSLRDRFAILLGKDTRYFDCLVGLQTDRAAYDPLLRTKYCAHLQGERILPELLERLDKQLHLLDPGVVRDLRDLNRSTQSSLHAAAVESALHSLTENELQGLANLALSTMVKI